MLIDVIVLMFDIWIAVANWGIPIAAIADFKKDPSLISGNMTVGKRSAAAAEEEKEVGTCSKSFPLMLPLFSRFSFSVPIPDRLVA
jgi:hypothetical protein